jgi:capsular exopolysaccharide synthesis family protein
VFPEPTPEPKGVKPGDGLRRRLRVDKGVSSIVKITLDGDRPEELEQVLDAVVGACLKEADDQEQEHRQNQLRGLNRSLEGIQDELARRRRVWDELARTVSSNNPQLIAEQQRTLGTEIAQTQLELLRAQADQMRAESEVLTLEGRSAEAILEVEVEDKLRAEPKYIELLGAKEIAERVLEEGKRVVDPAAHNSNPNVSKLRAAVADAEAKLQQFCKDNRPRIKAELAGRARRNHGLLLAEKRERRDQLRQFQALLADSLEGLRRKAENAVKNQVELDALRQKDAPLERLADRLATEIGELEAAKWYPPRATRGERATADWATAEGKRIKIAGAAGLLGLLLGLGLVGYREARLGRIDGQDVVARVLGVPVVGALPRQRRRRRCPPAGAVGAGKYAECADLTRTRLLHGAGAAPLRSLVVTSAVPGEGKTTTSCHLAASLARVGRKTLLLDGDMRRPSAHRVFGVPLGPGFAEVLRGEAAAAAAARPTPVDGLWLLPAGRWDPAAAQALGRPQLGPLLDELRGQFDVVVIDAPPVLPVADALLLGRQADGVLLTLLHGVSQVGTAHHALERLGEIGVPVLGVVLNGLQVHDYGCTYEARQAGEPVG